MVGPASPSALVDPHPVARDSELFLSSELCGKCHENTFDEWHAVQDGDKLTCQQCHMPPVTRKLTQGTSLMSNLLVAFEEEYEGRQHLFHIGTEAVLEAGLEVELTGTERGGEGVSCELTLVNKVPHLLPTGDFGVRWLGLIAEGVDADGVVVSRSEWQLRHALGQSLEPGERRVESVTVGPTARALRLSVSSVTAGGEPTLMVSRRWELP